MLISGCGIAQVNPYRYRGYYYDAEIEMYYLQSRYYEPVMGRFINSDNVEFAIVCSGTLKTNLYTYCKNQTLNYGDPDGKDAIWLQATNSVWTMGHTGLVFKYKKEWYYWYWGIDPNAAIWGYLPSLATSMLLDRPFTGTLYSVASTTVLALCNLVSICKKSSLTQDDAIAKANKIYCKDEKKDPNKKFNKSFYITGDFEKSYNYFNSLKKSRNYNLLSNNCMQTTVDGINKGKFSKYDAINKGLFWLARGMVIPNVAYNYLKKVYK